ncbi:hypothetical protein OF83DRAFT_1119114, partial [Amylostereum chailletii]
GPSWLFGLLRILSVLRRRRHCGWFKKTNSTSRLLIRVCLVCAIGRSTCKLCFIPPHSDQSNLDGIDSMVASRSRITGEFNDWSAVRHCCPSVYCGVIGHTQHGDTHCAIYTKHAMILS